MKTRVDLLLVEDNADDTALFGRAVRGSGLDIRSFMVGSGHQAIEYLEAKGNYSDRSVHPLPDVIVLDLRMPGLNGFDFLAWRKVSGLFLAIPVVVFSGLRNEAEARKVFELGANKHIAKPEAPENWQNVITEIYDFTVATRRSST